MTFCFLIDVNPEMKASVTSSSVVPKFSALDIAKAGVEAFLLATTAVPNMPLILATNGDDRSSILSSLGSPLSLFESGLKNLCTCDTSRDFSYSLSLNFSLYNKNRLKNGIDRFGYGLSPFLVDPFNTIIITSHSGLIVNESLSFQKSSKESQNRANLSELIGEPWRWDQHIYLVVIADEDNSEVSGLIQNGALAKQARATGGEVFRCSNMKTCQAIFKDLAMKIFFNHPSVTVKIAPEIPPDLAQPLQPLLVHMSIKEKGEWLIPESYWLDLGTEHLKQRSAQPLLSLSTNFMVSPGNYNNENPPIKFLQLAKSLDIRMDTYDLCVSKVINTVGIDKNQLKHQSISNYLMKRCGFSSDRLFVTVQGSNRLESAPGVTTSYPFAILSSGKSVGSWELIILPYNFPKLFPLLKFALDQLSSQQVSWMASWKQEFTAYLRTVPQYCQQSILQTLQKTYPGIRSLLQIAIEDKIHKGPFRKIQRSQEFAVADVAQIERLTKETWPDYTKDINTLAIESSTDIVKSANIPRTVYDVKKDQLLGTWEKMRRIMYGSYGFVTHGLSVAGLPLTDTHYHVFTSTPTLIERCDIGASTTNSKSVKEMSDYRPTLAVREVLRDPENLTPDADEDTIEGLLKRKFDVNFGNRFKKSKKTRGKSLTDELTGMEIEGISGLVMSAPKIDGMSITEIGPIEQTPSSAIAKADLFFMDTPNPYAAREGSIASGITSDDSMTEQTSQSPLQSPTTQAMKIDSSGVDDRRTSTTSPLSSLSDDYSNEPSIAASPKLPENWTECFSSRHNRAYWFNSVTGKSVWEFPTS